MKLTTETINLILNWEKLLNSKGREILSKIYEIDISSFSEFRMINPLTRETQKCTCNTSEISLQDKLRTFQEHSLIWNYEIEDNVGYSLNKKGITFTEESNIEEMIKEIEKLPDSEEIKEDIGCDFYRLVLWDDNRCYSSSMSWDEEDFVPPSSLCTHCEEVRIIECNGGEISFDIEGGEISICIEKELEWDSYNDEPGNHPINLTVKVPVEFLQLEGGELDKAIKEFVEKKVKEIRSHN